MKAGKGKGKGKGGGGGTNGMVGLVGVWCFVCVWLDVGWRVESGERGEWWSGSLMVMVMMMMMRRMVS